MDVNLERVVCAWSCSGRDVEVCGVCGGWFCDYHFPAHPHPDLVGNEQPAAIRHCPGAEWPHKPHWWDSAGQVYPCDGEPDTQAGNSTYWPPTSELDPRLAPKPADPAPAGLTAPQKIRLVAAQCVFGQTRGVHVAPGESHDDFERRLPKVLKLAALIEYGADTVVCPDPAMHDPLRGDIAAQRDAAQKRGDAYRDLLDKARDEIAELRTGLLEAHADLEASRAREQIAAERVAEVLAYIADCEASASARRQDLLPGFKQIRAILADDQGEEA